MYATLEVKSLEIFPMTLTLDPKKERELQQTQILYNEWYDGNTSNIKALCTPSQPLTLTFNEERQLRPFLQRRT